jgi:hypothetical protein
MMNIELGMRLGVEKSSLVYFALLFTMVDLISSELHCMALSPPFFPTSSRALQRVFASSTPGEWLCSLAV